jgi:hypothetical protein
MPSRENSVIDERFWSNSHFKTQKSDSTLAVPRTTEENPPQNCLSKGNLNPTGLQATSMPVALLKLICPRRAFEGLNVVVCISHFSREGAAKMKAKAAINAGRCAGDGISLENLQAKS